MFVYLQSKITFGFLFWYFHSKFQNIYFCKLSSICVCYLDFCKLASLRNFLPVCSASLFQPSQLSKHIFFFPITLYFLYCNPPCFFNRTFSPLYSLFLPSPLPSVCHTSEPLPLVPAPGGGEEEEGEAVKRSQGGRAESSHVEGILR